MLLMHSTSNCRRLFLLRPVAAHTSPSEHHAQLPALLLFHAISTPHAPACKHCETQPFPKPDHGFHNYSLHSPVSRLGKIITPTALSTCVFHWLSHCNIDPDPPVDNTMLVVNARSRNTPRQFSTMNDKPLTSMAYSMAR